MPAILRLATRDDVPAMQRIRHSVRENRLTSRSISDAEVIETIEQTGRGWVIDAHGETVAFAIGNQVDGSVWALFVDPAHEGRGYGRRLHDVMVAWLQELGHDRLWLTTEPNTRAERFYRLAGWEDHGLTPSGERRFERN
jgi:GNAT superfamily N-acetyltransferase